MPAGRHAGAATRPRAPRRGRRKVPLPGRSGRPAVRRETRPRETAPGRGEAPPHEVEGQTLEVGRAPPQRGRAREGDVPTAGAEARPGRRPLSTPSSRLCLLKGPQVPASVQHSEALGDPPPGRKCCYRRGHTPELPGPGPGVRDATPLETEHARAERSPPRGLAEAHPDVRGCRVRSDPPEYLRWRGFFLALPRNPFPLPEGAFWSHLSPD